MPGQLLLRRACQRNAARGIIHHTRPFNPLARTLATTAAPSAPSAASAAAKLQPGTTLHGFNVLRVQEVPQFNLTAIQLKHEKTGAEHLHVAKDDSNNVFNVGFHTPVSDSTGVPHILEHVTLCGSKNYPVRDPFFKMLNRSMATFMNAMTGSDYTMYPFSTQNPVDYKNLMDVYMDSTFAPMLREMDFKQEGWRLENEVHTDRESPLIFKGVVYNEMKGALSDLSSLFYIRSQQHMYPGGTYSHVSGGDPESITNLTHQQLLDFHARHYHPSNARFYTYGNFELEKHLQAIDARISNFAAITLESPTPTRLFTERQTARVSCPPDSLADPAKQTKMSVSFLTNESNDIFETFAVGVLTSLLLDGAASPMYKALIATNIGSDYAATTGYNSEARVTNVSFGLQGIKSEDVQRVEDIIMRVLTEAAQTGFDPKRVESVLHQTELSLKHRNANFGMMVGQQVMSSWIHGADPLEFLKVAERIERLRGLLATPRYFESLIEKYFLNNKHRLVFVMEPDAEYNDNLLSSEKARLEKKVGALTAEDKDRIYLEGIKLAESQETKSDVSCLPTLTVQDIPVNAQTHPTEDLPLAGVPVQWRKTATNGISYVNVARDINKLPSHLQPYIPLYASALGALSTKNHDLPVLDEAIRMHTGGISASVASSASPQSLSEAAVNLTFSSNCLDKNISSMYHLMGEIASHTSWQDQERLRTVVSAAASDASQGVVQNGHRYAMKAAAAGLTQSMQLTEALSGLTQVGFLGKLARNGVDQVGQVAQKMEEIAAWIASDVAPAKVAVISDPAAQDAHKRNLDTLLKTLDARRTTTTPPEPATTSTEKRPSSSSSSSSSSPPNPTTDNNNNNNGLFTPTFSRRFFALPLAVNFTARTFLGVPYTHADGAALQLLASLMTNHFLHREIREKGGAYGGGATYNALEGTLSLFSYRDPPSGLANTLKTYERAIEWASSRGGAAAWGTQRELDEAKLSVFQSLDAPKSASAEGMTRFHTGVTNEMLQERRERLLAVTVPQIADVAQRYLLAAGQDRSAFAVLGGKADAELFVKSAKEPWQLVDFE
ncbi:Mitochondrial presequence protease [Geranomyces variabilis]|uniref:Presequence protease, mitochondrial n=1 Tax=Geranomyces variabilis TaxID=109894 RepID=A0AAD5THJ7_9FUNG|nr:Mitochondrial presequence protease [Geranomyces variabilis]